MTRSEDASSPSDDDNVGLDALDGEQGPARPLSARELDAIADRVVLRLAAKSTAAGREPSVARESSAGRIAFVRRFGSRGFGSKGKARWLVIAAGATLATAAAAFYGTSWFAPTPPAPHAAPRDGAALGDDVERAPSVAPAPLPADEALEPDGRPINDVPTAPDRETELGGRSTPTRAHESRQAADHLARANALRGRHQYREALERYLYVVSEYPGSMQGRAAQLAAAAIRLEQLSDVDGAEALYRAVKNTSEGELAAQALFGLAEVARARADRGGEKRALLEFLARHGGHPLASAAQRRLGALEAP